MNKSQLVLTILLLIILAVYLGFRKTSIDLPEADRIVIRNADFQQIAVLEGKDAARLHSDATYICPYFFDNPSKQEAHAGR
ncbi:hypothetical protein NQZ89_11505 [Streptococcus suis]|nr:hypothetical protein [Streptococcus suis]UUM61985.1 hypothetical protein NQZ89_11505 [Streptococcus suis]